MCWIRCIQEIYILGIKEEADMIKVSVIIPIYNVEQYIEECILSVINQTLKDIEIICVNDGTLDWSMDIIHQYAIEDKRIIVINQKNQGLSVARNVGLAHARGEYIYFLDGDDYIDIDMLEVLYGEVKKHDLDNIYFDAEAFFETEELEQTYKSYKTYYNRLHSYQDVVSGKELFMQMNKNKDFKPAVWIQMLRRNFLLENNLCFYKGIIHEDNLFSLQVILLEDKVKHIPKTFYYRRIREDSIMTSGIGFKNSYGYMVCISELIWFIKEHPIENTELLQGVINLCYAWQSSSIKAIEGISDWKIDEMISTIPVKHQLEYMLYIRQLAKQQ